MSDFSFSDLVAAIGAMNGGNMGGGSFLLVVLILVFFLRGGIGGAGAYGQMAAQASTTQDILYSSKFQALDNKMDRGFTSIGNGISDATYALNNAITGEGRGIQMQLADGFARMLDTVRDDGEKTRGMIQANEMARIRDDRDYWRGKYGYREETDRILYTQGQYYNNPPCEKTCNSCC